MQLDRGKLKDLIAEVAHAVYGPGVFSRRPLMELVERRLRNEGWWEPSDDTPSRSASPKSLGLAAIDFAISDLASESRIVSLGHDQWKLAGTAHGIALNNGHSPSTIAARLARLAIATGGLHAAHLPPGAMSRESLYGDDA